MIHSFDNSLAQSHANEDNPIWEEIYRQAFPDFVGMHSHKLDGQHQRLGIDRSVILANSKQVLIDEKYRDADYGDLLLEYLADRENLSPGWVCKPLLADYICYAVLPAGKAYLLPVIQLQAAWLRNSEQWLKQYKKHAADNRGWTTMNLAVPTDVVLAAISAEFRLSFRVPLPEFQETRENPYPFL